MISTFQDYTGCPAEFVHFDCEQKFEGKSGFFKLRDDLILFGRNSVGRVALTSDADLFDVSAFINRQGNKWKLPFSVDEVCENLFLEKYEVFFSKVTLGAALAKKTVRTAYYALRPLFPVWFRKYLQRFSLRNWQQKTFPHWPVDCTVEKLIRALWLLLLQSSDEKDIPFIWFWLGSIPAVASLPTMWRRKQGLNYAPA